MGNELEMTAARANGPFGELVVKALRAFGVSHFVISPGSRSTPLALAVAGLPEEMVTASIDERSAAFHALGRIKATRNPAALICTSGTAGAHYFPAIIEAREAGLPLFVLTADRPPELRHCHAGQTIDQSKLFGTYPVFDAELPVPECSQTMLRQVREICRRAMEAAIGAPRGPVHINCPFREPFLCPSDEEPFSIDPSILEGIRLARRAHASPGQLPELPEKTLILAGPRPLLDESSEWESLLDLSWNRGFPVLADAANPLRYHASESPHVIIHYDRMSRDDAIWEQLQPEAVILWGEPPTSKVLRQRLVELDVRGYLVGEGPRSINPIHGRIEWAGKSVAAFVERTRGGKGHFGEQWARLDRATEDALEQAMAQPHPVFEGDVHRLLGEVLPAETPVIYSSSLAIRDAEWFMPRRREPLHPFSQRGANGIDGMLSLSRGIVAGMGRAGVLVTGELAFLHDSNGLLGSADMRHTPCPEIAELRAGIEKWDGKGLQVLEVPVDRKASRDLHRQFVKLTP
jgi:2-succinyl-5-enolpyruvyl-6-hydroxy-3-cyclohexene-1-carboxylate synthase